MALLHMKAVTQHVFGPPDVLQISDVPRPQPLPTEVLVRVHAAGVNPIDWKTRAGHGLPGIGEPPFILGWDVSGVVEEVGFGVHTLRVGDEVYGMPWFPRQAGGYAEYVTAPARQFAAKPTTLDHEHAAAVPLAALTARQALADAARITPGQRVLVHAAAGGVGHLAVQVAKHMGAHVIATARAANHDWLRDLGADELIDYTEGSFEEAVNDIDVVLDLVGDATDRTSIRSLDTLRPGGLIIPIPGASAELIAEAGRRSLTVTPFLVEPDGVALANLARIIDAGELHVEVQKILPLAHAPAAHVQGEQGHNKGKLVLRVVD
ncbi:NADP-dependent oxidoreductase [Micromonospora parathelypteridis]|uniref:NADPH:quinone reductase-like Zn-dependent oxidoreductase n=1 Tax=Micromonospora parathelypteridis TaxID=1839617 RepID=A0A840VTN3_9ACTN|nr:NADP-dependent oxidoreductase [Micromonospora parathelypteridis]MBB5479997.1 NADPH:quinone reductase-like Zn-dependent oxidoreductase [Micromonospora parathelypteridis]GGO25508.1 NADPH:quinone reductase [Micromonospora parathelypteridis]